MVRGIILPKTFGTLALDKLTNRYGSASPLFPKYSFKAFFVPKLGNHRNSSDIAIEYIKFDPNNPEEMKKYEKMIVGIKEKTIAVANQGKYKPSKVLEILEKKDLLKI